MKLKTFRAASMHEALALVKKSLGPHAVILHTRSFREGGLFGMFSRAIVEITASDQTPESRRSPSRKQAPRPPAKPEPTAGDLIRRTYAAAAAELTKNTPPPSRQPNPQSTHVHTQPKASATLTPLDTIPPDQLAEEICQVKRMVAQVMRHQRQQVPPPADTHDATGPSADPLFRQYLTLLEQEVAEELADQVIANVRTALDETQLKDDDAIRKAVLIAVADLIPTDPASGEPPKKLKSGRPRTIALVGPTGVGKTTTIAKLAATFKLKQKMQVGLITADTYRIAAVEQLRTYADIIGVPLQVAATPEEIIEAQRQCRGCDVVLIDTAGRGQRDTAKLDSLATLLKAAKPHEIHLVLSSTCSQQVLIDTVERFSAIPTNRIIFTKLDEAVSFGVLLTVARKVNKQLSYVTTGQEVPNQIEPSRSINLASLVLGEEIAPSC